MATTIGRGIMSRQTSKYSFATKVDGVEIFIRVPCNGIVPFTLSGSMAISMDSTIGSIVDEHVTIGIVIGIVFIVEGIVFIITFTIITVQKLFYALVINSKTTESSIDLV